MYGEFLCPRTWPKKRTYPRTVKTTVFEKAYNGDVLFEETEIIESKTTTTKCRFLKLLSSNQVVRSIKKILTP